jgi:hypothetical protein
MQCVKKAAGNHRRMAYGGNSWRGWRHQRGWSRAGATKAKRVKSFMA